MTISIDTVAVTHYFIYKMSLMSLLASFDICYHEEPVRMNSGSNAHDFLWPVTASMKLPAFVIQCSVTPFKPKA